MTREQILKTAMEIYDKPIKNFTSEHGDFDGVLEYLDGAIGELVDQTRRDAVWEHKLDTGRETLSQ